MIAVNGLVWDDWNRSHLGKHNISPEEVEEVCHGEHQSVESYRKRILIMGETKTKKHIAVVLSPEDVSLKPYRDGVYYVVTAFETEVMK